MPKAGVAGDGRKRLIEGGGIDAPLSISIGFMGVLQDILNIPLDLAGEVQGIAFRGGHRDYRFLCPAWRVVRRAG